MSLASDCRANSRHCGRLPPGCRPSRRARARDRGQRRRDPCQDAAHREAQGAARFGRSSDKLEHDIEQLELLIGALETDQAEYDTRAAANPARQDPATAHKRQHPVRKPLPAHLPREVVTHEPACACPGCGSTTLSRIGQDERASDGSAVGCFAVGSQGDGARVRALQLQGGPAHPAEAELPACEIIVQQPMPTQPIERGLQGPGLVAHVLFAKFCDHTPLHRQSGIYAREGVELDRVTLAD